jgi:hypothetical protein
MPSYCTFRCGKKFQKTGDFCESFLNCFRETFDAKKQENVINIC